MTENYSCSECSRSGSDNCPYHSPLRITSITLSDATIDRIARKVAHYLRAENQARVDAELAAERRRMVPPEVIQAATVERLRD